MLMKINDRVDSRSLFGSVEVCVLLAGFMSNAVFVNDSYDVD